MLDLIESLCNGFTTAVLLFIQHAPLYVTRPTSVPVRRSSKSAPSRRSSVERRPRDEVIVGDQTSLPGPGGLPYFGYMLSLGAQPHETLADLAVRYTGGPAGGMFQLRAGCRRFVVVSNLDTVEDLARRFPEELYGKPRTFTTDQLSIGAHNDMLQRWKRRRAHTNAGLKYLERYSVLDIIDDEVSGIVKYLKKIAEGGRLDGEGVGENADEREGYVKKGEVSGMQDVRVAKDVRHDISFFVSRVIYRMSYGSEPDTETERSLREIVHALPDYTSTIGSFSPFDLIPSLRHIYADKFAKFIDFNQRLSQFCRGQKVKTISEKSSHAPNDANSPTASLFEYFRRRWAQMSDANKSKYDMKEDTLYDGLEDIIRAGTESSSLIIQWFLLYVCAFPHVQRRMQQELDECLRCRGRSAPDADDLRNLHYCQAVLTETYRYSCLNPFLKRELTDDVVYDGYLLRRGTVLLYNQWAINNDEKYFNNPRCFQPERFLDADGVYDETLTRKFMPFGFGKRCCIGIYTGKMLCLLTALTVVYKFDVELDERDTPADLQPIFGIGLSPKSYRLKFRARKN